MNTNRVDLLDLEAGTLKLVDEEAQGSRSVSTRENVLVHEQAPDEILVLPRLAQTSDLEEEDTIVVHHVVDLLQERREVTDTDVFCHFETSDLLVATLGDGNVAVVHAQNLALLLGNAHLAHRVVAPGGLVATKSDTSSLGSVVDTSKAGEGTPATANIQKRLALLQTNLFAHDSQLVVLELLEAFLLVDVGDDARGVNHAGTQEPGVKVIAAVVVVANLLLICGRSVIRDPARVATK